MEGEDLSYGAVELWGLAQALPPAQEGLPELRGVGTSEPEQGTRFYLGISSK